MPTNKDENNYNVIPKYFYNQFTPEYLLTIISEIEERIINEENQDKKLAFIEIRNIINIHTRL